MGFPCDSRSHLEFNSYAHLYTVVAMRDRKMVEMTLYGTPSVTCVRSFLQDATIEYV